MPSWTVACAIRRRSIRRRAPGSRRRSRFRWSGPAPTAACRDRCRSRSGPAPRRSASSSDSSRKSPAYHGCAATSRSLRYRSMQRPGHYRAGKTSHRPIGIRIGGIGRLGELPLQRRADWRVEVQSLGRYFLHEPFVIQLLTVGALIERRGGAVDHFLEGGIVLAQHDAAWLRLRERVLGDDVGVRIFRSGDEGGEQDIVHHERHRAVGLHHQERLGMILRRDDVDAEVARSAGFGELLDVGGAGCRDHRLALEIVDRIDLAGFLRDEGVTTRKWVLVKETCFWRSALLVVEPHSRSMVPLASKGMRVDDVTEVNSTSSLSSLSSFFTAATIL